MHHRDNDIDNDIDNDTAGPSAPGTPDDVDNLSQSSTDEAHLGNSVDQESGKLGCWSRGAVLAGSFLLAVVAAATIFSGGGVGDIVAIATMVFIAPLVILTFPNGLAFLLERLFAPDSHNVIRSESISSIGWLIYLVAASAGLLVRERRWFWSVFGLWVFLLLANIAGCRPLFMKAMDDGFGGKPSSTLRR